jgi:predicted naringenin-chalcone synthase
MRRGSAVTLDAEATDVSLQPARAIRRALADAGMKAAELGLVCVATPPGFAAPAIELVLELALSQHRQHVAVEVMELAAEPDQASGGGPAQLCAKAVENGVVAGAVAVQLGYAQHTTAFAFGARR